MKVEYSFSSNNEFIIENYDRAKTFASFLPGIAGVDGIPMWSFYVNRGQVMGSFGVKDKDGTIMEFFPANVMYRNIEHQGFRTFIRENGEIHEIFSSASTDEYKRRLLIEKNLVRIEETNLTLGLKVTVTYFTMPGENYAALVRKVELENLRPDPFEVELLDGLPQILPAGAGNGEFQAISNLIRAWFDVCNLENRIACYQTRGTIADTVEVGESHAVNFYLAFSSESDDLIPPIYDMNVIFGENTALTKPDGWDCSADELHKKKQVAVNKVSGGFSGVRATLSDKLVLCTLIGHINDIGLINSKKDGFTIQFISDKEKAAVRLVESLVEDVCTKTSNVLFDQYIAQSYLDNLLRGGYPLIFGEGGRNRVYHVFSRKHGDTEREYNFFSLEPNFYSQGNGNYRDVNQNRRNDVLVKPEVSDFTVRQLMSLIQADGYNPLNVKGCTFLLDKVRLPEVMKLVHADRKGHDELDELDGQDGQNEQNKRDGQNEQDERDEQNGQIKLEWQKGQEGLVRLLGAKFTPGMLISYIKEHQIMPEASTGAFLEKVLSRSGQEFEAEFGEGYWSDHWTYNMDLVEAFLRIYPDQEERFLFDDCSYRFFYSPVYVLPREDKYVLVNGKVRQYGAIHKLDDSNMEKGPVHGNGSGSDTGAANGNGSNTEKGSIHGHGSVAEGWLRTENGNGSIYETNLISKLISLALNKFVNLDPYGMGIEMEANRPGWCDAMNGLPGLFGSGISETLELKRVIFFLIKVCSKFDRKISLFIEEAELLKKCVQLLDENLDGNLSDFHYWDQVSDLKEEYRSRICYGICGGEECFTSKEMLTNLLKFDKKLGLGLEKALFFGQGLYPTYFTYEALQYEIIEGRTNPVNGYRNVKITEFGCKPLPLFLEAPARALKTIRDQSEAKKIYEAVKISELYDSELKMYKTSVPLKATSAEVGRLMAFTPGWLEREAVFLHMEYKYLLAMLEAGLVDEFFEDIRTMLIPFLDPAVYGRSTLENSSFIASSASPDDAVHGRGFVARLTGSTAEVLSMWFIMMAGRDVFRVEDGKLQLALMPNLPGWLFDSEGKVSFRFLGKTTVTYHNPHKLNTYGGNIRPIKYLLMTNRNEIIEVSGPIIEATYAEKVRKGDITGIDAYLGV